MSVFGTRVLLLMLLLRPVDPLVSRRWPVHVSHGFIFPHSFTHVSYLPFFIFSIFVLC